MNLNSTDNALSPLTHDGSYEQDAVEILDAPPPTKVNLYLFAMNAFFRRRAGSVATQPQRHGAAKNTIGSKSGAGARL
jgi:hypothetical protein